MTSDASTRTPYTPPVTPPTTPPTSPSPPTPATDPTPSTPQIRDENRLVVGSSGVSLAAQRLERSRVLLQTALAPKSVTYKSTAAQSYQQLGGAVAQPTGLSSIPALALGLEAAKFWWSRHPLHLVGTQLATVANAAIQPVAQRSPVTLVAGAFLVGGLLAWAKPWRLVLRPLLFAGVMPQITSALVSHFTASAKKSTTNTKH
jgi:hypothetical protein